MGLELPTPFNDFFKIAIFFSFSILLVSTLNSYRGVPLIVIILFCLTVLLNWITTSTPFGRALFAVGGNSES